MKPVFKTAKSIAILGVSSSLLLIATLLPAANALESPVVSTVEVEAQKTASIVEPETVAALFGEDDLTATASGAIFSTQMALVSAVSRQVELARTPLGAKKVAKSILVEEYGFAEKEYKCLNQLWTQESNWNYKSRNKKSGAHGIPQALPATKMNVVSTDWRTNPVTQIRWGLRYISIRYETPCKAWAKHKRSNWY
ncbi:MAG: hypothetical protein RLY96_208 [Actinomycetota bacterium]